MKLLTLDPGIKGKSQENVSLTLYLQEPSENLAIQDRPMILICPGGGYAYTSDREAEPLALAFLAMGYHAAVLRYSVAPVRFPVSLYELAGSVARIRKNAEEWHVQRDKVFVLGCSAGGHLALSLGVFWNDSDVMESFEPGADRQEIIRPDGLILCYPVVTSGPYAHRGSFECLLGEAAEPQISCVSLEKQVTEEVPPVFLWHTMQDQSVPVENSLLLLQALRTAGVSAEAHLFEQGAHGLALANHLTENAEGAGNVPENAIWIELAHTWLKTRCGY